MNRSILRRRDVCARTDVLTHPEGQVAVRLALDTKAEGILEDGLIAVRRGIVEGQDVALLKGLPVEYGVPR